MKLGKTIIIFAAALISIGILFWLKKDSGFDIRVLEQEPKFKWGVQGSAYYLNNVSDQYQPQNIDIQIEYLKKLGVKYVRANLEFAGVDNPQYKANDDFVDKLVNGGFYPVMVIDPSFSDVATTDVFEKGYKIGKEQATRYKGKVRYFQLANEISGNVVNGGGTDDTFPSKLGDFYSKEKYKKFKEWVRGLSDGISAGNPKAKKILSGHWVYYDLIDYLLDDMVEFDIIGWAFYSDYTPTISISDDNVVEDETKLNISKELSKYDKDIWIIEANRAHGSFKDGEAEQAGFIKKTAQEVFDDKKITGYFVFNFIDQPEKPLDQDRHWGLLSVKNIKEKFYIDQEKPAFAAYREVIKESK